MLNGYSFSNEQFVSFMNRENLKKYDAAAKIYLMNRRSGQEIIIVSEERFAEYRGKGLKSIA
ncbi:hypothetical protein [Spirochaeta isovalerica]|uniref:Uncharacterized protein n=1 Tax=Spirochaeta isovalerica TaxID=150 RepID=A0A841RCV6_9SPIO|nr:hypothetical protein [Spirochaeta isovalerica]MBB6480488.1 hypothetical protein [Spirochaeta isovalerica]